MPLVSSPLLAVARHRAARLFGGAVYVSPYLLEILSTRPNAPTWASATGSLTANTGQTVSCSRAASGYCLGSDGLLHLLGANTVRVEPAGLLVEGQSTNPLHPSQAFTPGVGPIWQLFQSATVVDNDTTAPDGTATACRLIMPAGAAGQDPCLYQTPSPWTSGAISIYVKMGTMRYFAMGTDSGNVGVTVDLQTGSVADATSLLSSGVDVLGNGWYRVRATINGSGGETVYAFGNSPIVKQVYTGPATWSDAFGGYGWIWGAQMETALPFATSYIPTTSAAATRDADIVTVANPLNPSNPPVWRAGVTGIPYGSWIATNSPGIILACGPNGGANNWRLGVDGTGGRYDVQDATTLTQNVGFGNYVSGVAASMLGMDPGNGNLTTVPGGGTVSGGGSGLLTQAATIDIGHPNGFPDSFRFWGHLTDIIVDNT